MSDPILIAKTTLRDTRDLCEACEGALAGWARRNAWPPRRGDPVPAATGYTSDPTGQTAVHLAQEAQRDLDDIREARRLITDVLERRRPPAVTITIRTCVNCGWRAPSRNGRCPPCAEYWRVRGVERPRRLWEAERDRKVYPRV